MWNTASTWSMKSRRSIVVCKIFNQNTWIVIVNLLNSNKTLKDVVRAQIVANETNNRLVKLSEASKKVKETSIKQRINLVELKKALDKLKETCMKQRINLVKLSKAPKKLRKTKWNKIGVNHGLELNISFRIKFSVFLRIHLGF